MSDPSSCTSGGGVARSDSNGKDADVRGIVAQSTAAAGGGGQQRYDPTAVTAAAAGGAVVTWGQAQTDRIFAITETTDAQLARVQRERESHPAKTERMMRRGQLLVRFARDGHLREVDKIVSCCPRGEMLTWFAVRMLKEACLHNRLQMICFMVNHGLDVEFHAVLEAVHWLVDGCDEERDGADVVPALNFLVREAGMPPDAQRKSDYRTPLHVAVQRGLFEAARRLIELGADINAVAQDDVLPLTLAEQDIPPSTGSNGAPPSTTACPTTDNDTAAKETMATNALLMDSCRPLPNGSEETEERKETPGVLQDAEPGKGVGGIGAGGTDKPRSSCALPCRRRRRIIASRARICGLLVERGARRAWRRTPSEQQVALEKKYAALLEDDDGRNLCTFSG